MKAIGHSRLLALQQQVEQMALLSGFASPALEAEYAHFIRVESAPMRRALMSVPFIAMVLAPLYGALLLHNSGPSVFWLRLIEFALAAPICAYSVYRLSRYPDSSLTTRVLLIASVVVFWAVALIRWVSAQSGGTLSPELVMVVPLAVAAVGRLRMFLILPMVVLCSTLFLIAEYYINGPQGYSATLLGCLLFAALSIMTAITTDQLSRRTWLTRCIIELTAMSDAITGLPNRQWLNRDLATQFSQAIRNGEMLAICLIDLDHFKKLNDSHGHAAGDAALTAVGQVLANFGRRPLDLVGRFGGEEFLLSLYNPKQEGLLQIADALVLKISALNIINKGANLGYVTASVGIYFAAPQPEDRPEDFLRHADVALYAAKHAGRNRYRLSQPDDPLLITRDLNADEVFIPIT